MIRLAKKLASHRVFSRREAERAIIAGRVRVNGRAVRSENGFALVSPDDTIEVQGFGILPKTQICAEDTKLFLCNKLEGELVTYSDLLNRPTLFDRLKNTKYKKNSAVHNSSVDYLPNNLIAVGRLDFKTQGLILLTDNGYFSRQLELPANQLSRRYTAVVWTRSGDISARQVRRLETSHGLRINNVDYKAVKAKVVKENTLEVEVREGKYREVRRLLEASGMNVVKLTRTKFGPFEMGKVHKGEVVQVSIPSILRKYLSPSHQ